MPNTCHTVHTEELADMERRLSTILAADVVGYSVRMGENEADTINRLSRLSGLIDTNSLFHGGRVFSRAGDGFLVEFASPVSAVRSAYELQQRLAGPEAKESIGLVLRIGLHLADVVVEGDTLLGDGVNVASRIEAEAAPGAILVSSAVFDFVKRTAQLRFAPQGQKNLKNISEPIVVYSVEGEVGTHSCATALMISNELRATHVPQSQPRSVVVIPYKNIGSDPEQEYFADGFTDDLITELSRFSDIFTISRNASFGLKGKDADASEIGKILGVQYCLEGGVRKVGNRVRINSYLVDAISGKQLWAEKSDCTYDDLFDVQDDLIAKIVSSVAGQIGRQAEAVAKRKRPNDLLAYDCFLRGLELHRIGGVTMENAQKSVEWFDRALKGDPSYGRAYAWRACAVATVAEWTGEDVWSQLVEDGRLAIELDETDADSHRIAGSLSLYQRNFDRALYHFNRAIELNPNHAFIVGRMGEIHNFLGDGKTALEFQKRAMLLDPFLPAYCRELEAIAYYVLQDYLKCYEVIGEFTRLTRRAAAYRVAAAVNLESDERVKEATRALLTIDPHFDPASFVRTEFYKDQGKCKQLTTELQKAISSVFSKGAVSKIQ
jgi:adenylate cyclase